MKIFRLLGSVETYMYCSQNGNVRQCCGNDVDYNIHFVVSSEHPPAPSEPQINVVPLTYVGKLNIRKSGQKNFIPRMHHSGDRHMFPYGNVRRIPRKNIIINLNRSVPWISWNLVMPWYNVVYGYSNKKITIIFCWGDHWLPPVHACSHMGTAMTSLGKVPKIVKA